ncbi:hypothetical protein RRG08_054284 [Elysia crispata]|uniref:Uncharacterized protein n=1 Tax=Elysia crispata TaxID=231223 RepID=A0AAE1CLY1_9GAST|nr:hypothetical protein RRG08_054284 [Elysia crispata]
MNISLPLNCKHQILLPFRLNQNYFLCFASSVALSCLTEETSVSTCRCKPPSVCKKTPRSYKHSASFPAGPEHDTDLEPSGEAPDTDEKEQGTTEL